MSKKTIVVKSLIRRSIGIVLFVSGVAVLLADAWIEHMRCVVAGVIIMVLSILSVIDHKYPRKATMKQAIVQGAIFWMIMFVVISVMIAFRIYQYPFAKFFILPLSGTLAYLFARRADPEKTLKAVFMGAIFTVIGLLLDAAITNRFDGSLFSSVYLWASYIFIMIGAVAGGLICGMTKRSRKGKAS